MFRDDLALPYSASVIFGAGDDGVALIIEGATEYLVSMAF